MRRFGSFPVLVVATVVALVGAGAVMWAATDEPTVDRSTLDVACPGGGEVVETTLDYGAGAGAETPEAALLGASKSLEVPGLAAVAREKERNSTSVRYELPLSRGVLLIVRVDGGWVLDHAALCQVTAAELHQ